MSTLSSMNPNEYDCPSTTRPAEDVTNTPTEVRAADQLLTDLERAESLVNEAFNETDDYRIEPPDCDIPPDFVLSVVIPVYNEEATIQQVVGRVLEIPIAKQIIVVDDCSTDRTREILKAIGGHPDMQVVLQEKNEGKGAALRSGIRRATGDVVVIQDADLEYDPRDIPTLLVPILTGQSDVVYGSRFSRKGQQDCSWAHCLGNRLLTAASNLTTGLALSDMETCYKAFRKELLDSVDIEQDRFGFEPEITAKLARQKARFSEVPIRYAARSYEEGKKIGIKDLFNAFWCIAKYGWF